MLRKTLTILSLIGLILGVVLWGVSYFTLHFRTPVRGTLLVGMLHRGSIQLQCIGPSRYWYGNRRAELWFEGFGGYTAWRPHVATAKDYLMLIVPLWIPTLLSSALFLSWVAGRPPESRPRRGSALGILRGDTSDQQDRGDDWAVHCSGSTLTREQSIGNPGSARLGTRMS